MARARRRTSPFRLLRALWRYRGAIAAHGDRYQVEIATAVHTALAHNIGGRVALAGYRGVMRLLLLAAIAAGVLTLLAALVLWVIAGDWWFLVAAPLLVLALWLAFLRARWGAPLDWLTEHADTTRQLPLTALPGRLREVAAELRELSNVPANVARELDALAGDVEREQGPHVA